MGSALAAPETQATALDRSAALQQRSKQFSAAYEAHAYVVYNLALRICCDEAQALECAQQAFLSRVAADDLGEGLDVAAVAAALAVAAENPAPSGAGDAEAQQMLAATARLSPPQRAALAVLGLTEASVESLASMLSLAPDAAARLHERALSELGAILGGGVDVATVYRAWLWAAPPDRLWESVFPLFYVAADELIRGAEPSRNVDTPTEALKAPSATRKQRRAAKRAASAVAVAAGPAPSAGGRAARRLRPDWLTMPIMFVVMLCALAAFAAATQLGLLSGGHSSGPTFGNGGAPAPSYGTMSPAKLDQLRMKELQQSRAYAAQQARQHPPLTPAEVALQQRRLELQAQKQAASQKAAKQRQQAKQVAALKKQRDAQLLAFQKQQAQQIKAQQQAIARQRQLHPPAATPPASAAPYPQAPAPRPRPKPRRPPSSSGSGSGSANDANCLYSPDTKSYVCPSG
ncbi:MAG TPA: hypothetical protein VGN69_03845 [Solirubrobacteraceae bacterium]|nr:hypothetical protein [Solirubrobacteraceae bacterium]